jgi:ABC-type lipoprotein release transport system permease subunit
MEPKTVVWVLIVAVLSAVLGALLPAMRAAVMNPVEALRYE